MTEKRLKGESKISIIKYLEIALSAITSFTKAPLFIIFFLGIIIFSISLILMIVYLILFLLGKIDQPGFTTIILIQLFFSGLIMFVVSIISIYVGYILDEVKKRPTYIIEDEEKNKIKKILITGANGFIGKHLKKKLLNFIN